MSQGMVFFAPLLMVNNKKYWYTDFIFLYKDIMLTKIYMYHISVTVKFVLTHSICLLSRSL